MVTKKTVQYEKYHLWMRNKRSLYANFLNVWYGIFGKSQFFWNHLCNQNTEGGMIFMYFNIGWILKILVSLNQKLVLDSQKKTLKTKKVTNLVKLAIFSEKWWDFKYGFNAENERLLAKWKPLFKVTPVDVCFSISFLNFKTPLLNGMLFEKQYIKTWIIHPG